MFNSLRAKLIATYALVIILSLVLAGVAFAVYVRNYQTQRQLNELADDAVPLAFNVRSLERTGATAAEVQRYLRAQATDLNVRIFLVGSDRKIILDTDQSLVGQVLPTPIRERRRLGLPLEWGDFSDPNGIRTTFVQIDSSALRLGRPLPADTPGFTPIPDYDLIVAVPEERVTEAWLQLAPGLGVAAFIALVLSAVVALFLARSIAGPIVRVTRASEQMARGDFDQFIPATSRDEVGQLARSFNAMAQEVGRMHRAMRDLLANVSHELRTPLTSIEGFSAAMVDGTLTSREQFRDAALVIGEEAERMNRLVNDLLYLSKIESGQIPIERESLSLPDLLLSCARQIQPQAENADVEIEVDLDGVSEVVADRLRLQQVFVNLLANAVRHTPSGGKVQVRAFSAAPAALLVGAGGANGKANVKDSGSWVSIDVHNPGSYIPPAQQERIFERFFQVDGSRAGRDGVGLGLAIVQEIVQAHRGRVEVRSDPAQGTTFRVVIPAT